MNTSISPFASLPRWGGTEGGVGPRSRMGSTTLPKLSTIHYHWVRTKPPDPIYDQPAA